MNDTEKRFDVHDLQRARREGFVAGAAWGDSLGALTGDAEEEARRQYPIRRKVPREVRLAGSSVRANVKTGRVCFVYAERAARVNCLTPEHLAQLADLLANPYEEIQE
jgi:hypothetical protein